MYDIREDLMQKMVRELRHEQSFFEIMSDEEFYNSDYGIKRRQRNQTCSAVVYMHCLMPGSSKNLLGVYFHKRDIAIAAPTFFEEFITDIVVDRETKGVFKKPYFSFRVIRKDYEIMYDDTKRLIMEMLDYAKKNHLNHT